MKAMKKGISIILEKYKHILDEDPLDDETADGQGYWFYLRPGFINAGDGLHLVHEHTIAECYGKLARVVPCACADCRRHGTKLLGKDAK